MSAVIFEHVVKRYGVAGRPAVDDCSLTVEEGQLVVLLGPSGCGKTTLLKMVNRIIEPTAGRILVDETDIQTLAATELRRRQRGQRLQMGAQEGQRQPRPRRQRADGHVGAPGAVMPGSVPERRTEPCA